MFDIKIRDFPFFECPAKCLQKTEKENLDKKKKKLKLILLLEGHIMSENFLMWEAICRGNFMEIWSIGIGQYYL